MKVFLLAFIVACWFFVPTTAFAQFQFPEEMSYYQPGRWQQKESADYWIYPEYMPHNFVVNYNQSGRQTIDNVLFNTQTITVTYARKYDIEFVIYRSLDNQEAAYNLYNALKKDYQTNTDYAQAALDRFYRFWEYLADNLTPLNRFPVMPFPGLNSAALNLSMYRERNLDCFNYRAQCTYTTFVFYYDTVIFITHKDDASQVGRVSSNIAKILISVFLEPNENELFIPVVAKSTVFK